MSLVWASPWAVAPEYSTQEREHQIGHKTKWVWLTCQKVNSMENCRGVIIPVGLRLRRESLNESEPTHPREDSGVRVSEARTEPPSRDIPCASVPRAATIGIYCALPTGTHEL